MEPLTKTTMAIYTKAPREVHDILAKLINADGFPDLKGMLNTVGLDEQPGLRFDLLFAYANTNEEGERIGTALKLRGIPVAAIIKQLPLIDRAAGRADVQIVIDADAWEDYSDNRKEALMHHELYHLEPRRDADGILKKDDLHRPLFRMRPHDWEIWGFHETARIYGNEANEVSAAHDMHRKFGQTVFAFMETDPTLPVGARRAA